MGGRMSAVEQLCEIARNRHRYARDWKQRTGRKVAGYLCTYVPEELLYAAGVLPVRILGSREVQDITDRYIFSTNWCAFCRDCLAEGLFGRYDYLDGLVNTWVCQHMRNAFCSWERHIPLAFSHELYLPLAGLRSGSSVRCFIDEIGEFRQKLEKWLGYGVTDQALDEAIQLYNLNRQLLGQLYELRKSPRLPLSGAEALEIVMASMLMDKAEANPLLAAAVAELQARDGDSKGDIRLMLVGSATYNVELVRFIESLGGQIVIDDDCVGTRYFLGEVKPEPDRVAAIAKRYCYRIPCPTHDLGTPEYPKRQRPPHVLKLAREWGAQGVIYLRQKFCDAHVYDQPAILPLLKDNQIPALVLEEDVITPVGQFRTRIEAFLESLMIET